MSICERSCLTGFGRDESGEIAPASYFFAFMLTLAFIFFVIDLGMRKGARIAVEYAAYCAARAAATQLPSSEAANNQAGACVDEAEQEAIEHAAAACLSAVSSKRGVILSLQVPGTISRLVKTTQKLVRVELMDEQLKAKKCFAHNDVITAVVHYKYTLLFPLSPLSYLSPRGLEMTAAAKHMVHTIK